MSCRESGLEWDEIDSELVGAVLFATVSPRRPMMPYVMIVVSSFIVTGAIAIFVVWEVLDLSMNLTESARQ